MAFMKALQHDCEFHNAMLMGQYIMVMDDGKMKGGGLIEGYDDDEVQIGQRRYSRSTHTFIPFQPPQCNIPYK
ncbi:hypothetical protein [Paenibacillus aestuarii]|uniref:Uncharacterized protein n=1 Tax=Paenibacillus aestuarii TaxID=516965 RepID=A0ABW0K3H9_9BACL|nr:hypothetical protein [Paenibacillus aestuarii]